MSSIFEDTKLCIPCGRVTLHKYIDKGKAGYETTCMACGKRDK